MTEMEKNRAVGIAAEQAAGRIRAMEWEDWQRMLLGLAHAATMIYTVAQNAEWNGKRTLAHMADDDMTAILQAMEILGWEKRQGRRAGQLTDPD